MLLRRRLNCLSMTSAACSRCLPRLPIFAIRLGWPLDAENRVYVIESHTSLRPSEYQGPLSDRIRWLKDSNGDGVADEVVTAAEGMLGAMSMAVAVDGGLYVTCANEIVALRDRNSDGIFDGRETIIRLETEDQHPHYRLAGCTVDKEGWLYFSRGNVGGHPHSIIGSDGVSVSGHGDGGAILRCRLGGTDLEEVATGFWNVLGMERLSNGWMLAADNDPEARGPNRLLHIVPGGDYGYRTFFGASGHHPFVGWEGELPGTLPMVAATREAPSGLLSCRETCASATDREGVLVACWGESVIERYLLAVDEFTVNGVAEPFLSGPDNFRPVAMAADTNGHIYVADWASNRYHNHEGGRVWRVSAKEPAGTYVDLPRLKLNAEAATVLDLVTGDHHATDGPGLLNLLVHDRPFLNHSVVEALAQPIFWEQLIEASNDTTPSIRLGALLAMRRAHHPDAVDLITRFLRDSDQGVRMAALRWATELRDARLVPALDEVLLDPKVSASVLEAYLAAKAALSPEVLEQLGKPSPGTCFELPFPALNGILESIITSKAASDHLRALSVMQIRQVESEALFEKLSAWVLEHKPQLQLAALHGLSQMEEEEELEIEPILKAVASTVSYEPQVRAEALSMWARAMPLDSEWVVELLDDHKPVVRLEAARALRTLGQLEPTLTAIQKHYDAIKDKAEEAAVAEQLEFILYGPHARDKKFASRRPTTLDGWIKSLELGGDVEAGRRLFHSSSLLCIQCHTAGAYQNSLGPSLENLGQSVTRERIIRSLIEPSANASPAYQAWQITTTDGSIERGVQFERGLDGSVSFIDFEGSRVSVSEDRLKSYNPIRESLMPHGLQALMTVREMRELVSYLEALGNPID